jgi:predicted peptidase
LFVLDGTIAFGVASMRKSHVVSVSVSNLMKPQCSPLRKILLTVTLLLIVSRSVCADVLDKTKDVSGITVHYKVVLPNGYDPAKAYPAVLAFSGGPQTMDTVERTVERNWRAEAERRGYIVIVPAAPKEGVFFEGGVRIFPEFLTMLLGDYKIQNNKFHIAGNSNGGISAYHIAASFPQYFISVTGFPGYLPLANEERTGKLANLCLYLHVGELDTDWLAGMELMYDQFRDAGLKVRFIVEKGQHHRIETLENEGAARLFDQFEEARKGCGK